MRVKEGFADNEKLTLTFISKQHVNDCQFFSETNKLLQSDGEELITGQMNYSLGSLTCGQVEPSIWCTPNLQHPT